MAQSQKVPQRVAIENAAVVEKQKDDFFSVSTMSQQIQREKYNEYNNSRVEVQILKGGVNLGLQDQLTQSFNTQKQ